MTKKLMSVGSLKTGSYVIFDGIACKVKSIQTSRPGKHGHAKCRVEAVSLTDNKKIIKVMPGHEKVGVPIIETKTDQFLSINWEVVNVMDMQTYETFDLKIPEELEGQIVDGAQVAYWIILDEKILKQVK